MDNDLIKKNYKTKIFIIVLACSILAVCIFFILLIYKMNASFAKTDEKFFDVFANLCEQDEYEFYSLDAYYLEDTRHYFYNAKYKLYSSLENEWHDIDEVSYGTIAKFFNSYCLSWEDEYGTLYGFEEINEEFMRAKEEGIHKSYTDKEIQEYLDAAYLRKE